MSQVANKNMNHRVRHLSLTPNDVTTLMTSSPSDGQSFGGMQGQMESELERRRKEWEEEVMRMQEDFFKVKVNSNNNNSVTSSSGSGLFGVDNNNSNMAKKNVEVELASNGDSGTEVALRNGNDRREIAAPRTEVAENDDGSHTWKLHFEMQGFDPQAINVKVDGNKLLVTSRIQQEVTPGNTSTKQFTRQVRVYIFRIIFIYFLSSTTGHGFFSQVDIPCDVNTDVISSSLSPAGVLTVRAPVDVTFSPPSPFEIEPPPYSTFADETDNTFYVRQQSPNERYVTQFEHVTSQPVYSERYRDIVPLQNDYASRAEQLKRSGLPSRRYSTNSTSSPATTTFKRYFSNYKDPGPLFPNSRGEMLRNKSPKGHIHHTPVVPATITIPRTTPLGVTSSSRYSSSLSPGFTTSSYRIGTPAERLRSKSVCNDITRSRTSSNPHKPRVTIIREYQTHLPGDDVISDTATSPTTQTSLFEEEFPASRDVIGRERFDSTSSGEKIITPTKYKTAKQRRAMSLSCSDSESSSLAASPPAYYGSSFQREISPRHLCPSLKQEQSLFVDRTNALNGNDGTEVLAAEQQELKPNQPLIATTKEGRRLRMLVEIGDNFRPEEVSVHLRFKKLLIRATQERCVDGRTCRSEFSKEFEIPSPLEPTSLRAALNGKGRLYIGGSLMSNDNHQQIVDLVLRDMPASARACSVKY